MYYDELHNKIMGDEYDSKLPFPLYKKSRTEQEIVDDQVMIKAWREDEKRLHRIFKDDLRKYIETDVGKPITDKQFDAIFNKAWDDGHASGYSEVLIYTSDIVDVIATFI